MPVSLPLDSRKFDAWYSLPPEGFALVEVAMSFCRNACL